MLQSLDGAAIRHWAATCCDAFAAHRDEINAINVFPVADSDTGSNLLATMRAGLDAVLRDHGAARDAAPGSMAAALARGALMGARGNSGVILSQVLRGLAEALAGMSLAGPASLDGPALREGLSRADELATAAVADPVSGTVLTVLHAAAQAAAGAPSDDLSDVARTATIAAAAALTETTRQLDVLAAAGVVDAGGRGLVVLLEALLRVVTECPDAGLAGITAVTTRLPGAPQASRESGSTRYEYEVMYLLDDTDDASVGRLRAELTGLGDCVAVVSSGQPPGGDAAALWNVHVHCRDVGAAIEAGIRAGRPHRVTVSRFADQASTGHAVLVMVAGCGLTETFRGAGAFIAPATSGVTELLAILAGTRAQHVTVLAGPAAVAIQVAGVAAARARDTGQEVVVVPVVSPVQALAAVAVHDASRAAAANVLAMTEAATATRYGQLAWAGRCQPSDVLGVIGDEIALIDRDPLAAARALVERMLSVGGELVTVLLGQQAPDGVAEMLVKHLGAAYPEVETVVYAAGLPDSMLLIGIE